MEPEHVTNTVLAVAALLITSGLGLIINVYALFALLKTRIFGAAFGRICISQSLANLGQMILFFCFICPMAIKDTNLFKTYLGGRPGQLLNFFWYSCIQSHLLSSINRLICLTFPLRYNKIFTKNKTTVYLVITWILSFLLISPQFNRECLMVFVEVDFAFKFPETDCGKVQAKYVDFALSVSIIALIIAVDVATSVKIYCIKKYTTTTNQKQQKQIRFFFQTVTEEIVLLLCVLSFYKVSEFFDGHWLKFFFTTWLWTFTHAIDGAIILLFNRELRWRQLKKLKKVFKKTTNVRVYFVNIRPHQVKPAKIKQKLVYSL